MYTSQKRFNWVRPKLGAAGVAMTIDEAADRLQVPAAWLFSRMTGRCSRGDKPKTCGSRSDGRYLYRLSEMRAYVLRLKEAGDAPPIGRGHEGKPRSAT